MVFSTLQILFEIEKLKEKQCEILIIKFFTQSKKVNDKIVDNYRSDEKVDEKVRRASSQ